MEFARSRKGIFVSQRKYVLDLLKEIGLMGCKAIAFLVSMISQFMHSPGQHHFDVVYRTLRHLKGIPRKGLLFEDRGHLEVEVYTDADWARSVMDRRSTSGYSLLLEETWLHGGVKNRMWLLEAV